MTVTEAFEDISHLIAEMNPHKVIRLKASAAMSERVADLVQQKKEGVISYDDAFELERLLALDLFISLTKAKARLLLTP